MVAPVTIVEDPMDGVIVYTVAAPPGVMVILFPLHIVLVLDKAVITGPDGLAIVACVV